MSVLIKGLNMPDKKNGAVLIFYPNGKVCYEDGTEYKAVELPPHRDFRDIEYLFNYVEDKYKGAKGEVRKAYRDVLDVICAATTIIEAEGEK